MYVWRRVVKLNREVTTGFADIETFDQRLERAEVSLTGQQ